MTDSNKKTYWIPLESNPETLTKLVHALGVPNCFGVSECFGLDEECLAFVPQPVVACIFLSPYSALKAEKQLQRERIEKEGQVVHPKVYFMRQTVGNACGTVAVVHALANCMEALCLTPDGVIGSFVERTRALSYEERGKALESDTAIESAHRAVATEGDTEAPEPDANVDFHFCAFCCVEGSLYELDGAKQFPINHGPCTPDNVLRRTIEVVRENFINKLDGDIRFSLLTIGPLNE